jgi:hypothetical protein
MSTLESLSTLSTVIILIHAQLHLHPNIPHPTKYIHIKSTTVYVPSLELGLSHPLSRQRVCRSPRNQRVGLGANSRAGEGLGESQFQRLEKKAYSTLPSLCPTPISSFLEICELNSVFLERRAFAVF